MYLTKEEERMYDGELGETLQKAMEILVAIGEIYEADKLIPIKNAHIAGVSYKTIGDAGLEWIKNLHGKVRVPSTLNPMGMDRERWKEMGISEEFHSKQMRVMRAYEDLGISSECTCTPYYVTEVKRGDTLAWSESSAVSFVNSVIGARTNREGAPSALASALVGKTPRYGLHIEENRVPQVFIDVRTELSGSDYGALGCIVGEILGEKIPLFSFRSKPSEDELKYLCAAMGASGAVGMCHFVHEKTNAKKLPEKITIEKKDIESMYGENDPEIIAMGCPHCSERELEKIANLLRGKKVRKELWICVSRRIKERRGDLVRIIESSGAKVICDTCMVVSPATERFERMMVDSGKAVRYVKTMCDVEVALGKREDCVKIAME
ncbi:MAG: aconitase X [Candidatus Syntropharchaeia archaeon]